MTPKHGRDAKVALVDRTDLEQRTQEIAADDRAHNAYNNIGDRTLAIIRAHDEAGYPATSIGRREVNTKSQQS